MTLINLWPEKGLNRFFEGRRGNFGVPQNDEAGREKAIILADFFFSGKLAKVSNILTW